MKFPTDRPVKVVMLGAGGTGGYVAPYVFRLLHMLDRPARFVVCDGDIVEPKNLDRQNFVPADLGENKARVLAERYSTVLGMETEYVPSFIEKLPDLMELIEPKEWELNPYSTKRAKEMVLLLGCVDNNKTRQLCHQAFHQSEELIYIDSGNGKYTGQVVCGVRRNGRTIRKSIGGVHPEMLKDTDLFPSEISCAEAAQEDPQSIVANVTAATAVLIMVYNILTHGENNAMQTDFSTRTIRMQTVLEKNKEACSMSRAVVDAKEFSHAMSKVSKILKKCAIPILEEVCLRIQNGRCTLTATDLETWFTAELPASGDDMFFAFRKTKDILRACSHFAGELTMEFSETQSGSKKAGRVLLRCERRGAVFEVYDGADYPNTPQASEGDAFSVSSARLSACVERVRYAAEKPSVSASPAAICVQFCGNRVYALDGTRLACDTLEGVSFPKPFLVRADVLAHLSAFGKEDMTVRIGSSHVLFASGNLRMLARLQGVDTYNVDAVIPKGYRESVTVKTADFVRELNYLKECSALTAKPYVRFAGERLSIAASSGAFETGIEVRGRGDMVLGFDLYHMLDALKQFKGEEEVCIHLSSPYAPIVIDAAGRSDFALVVPVRLKEKMAA